MLKVTTVLVCFMIASASIAHANTIINGSFDTCDLSGWQQDTDGYAGSANDFYINNTGNCQAEIQVDYWGAITNDVFYANTLFQDLDLTAQVGFGLNLSFDWVFDGEDGDALYGDYWFAALGDGTGDFYDMNGDLGSLAGMTSSYGSGSESFNLDSSLYNSTDWSIEFQVLPGVDPSTFDVNYLGSSLFIDNVSLSTYELSPTSVPEPASLALFMVAIAGLTLRQKRSK